MSLTLHNFIILMILPMGTSGYNIIYTSEYISKLQIHQHLIYMYDESFQNIEWIGVEIMLELFSGSTSIIWMQCIPGKA